MVGAVHERAFLNDDIVDKVRRKWLRYFPWGSTGRANIVTKYERAKVKCANLATTLWNNKMRLKGPNLLS